VGVELQTETELDTEPETEPLKLAMELAEFALELALALALELALELEFAAAVIVGVGSRMSGGGAHAAVAGIDCAAKWLTSSSNSRRSRLARSARRTCSSNPSIRLASHARAKSESMLALLGVVVVAAEVRAALPAVVRVAAAAAASSSPGSVAGGAAARFLPRLVLRFSNAFNARV
jgi:hypothetical protein